MRSFFELLIFRSAPLARQGAAALPFVVALGVLAAACPKPTDGTPQTAASPGAGDRKKLVPSRAPRGVPGKAAPAVVRAHAHPMRAGEALGGSNATGKAGDWVLENDEVVFVIDALGGGGGFAESGGNLVDAADAKARKDELGQLFTYFGTFPRQGVYTAIDARDEPDGTAVVEARGRELYDASIEVVTQYRLAPADRAVLLRTTLTNTGDAPVAGLGLGDAVQWGGVEKLAPGLAVGFKGPSTGPFIGGVGRSASYAITSTEGAIAAMSGGAWTDTEQKKNVTIGPHESVTYERVFVVGQRPDVASIVTELTRASGTEVGAVDIALVDAKGKPVRVPVGAKVVVGTSAGLDVMTFVATKEGETFGGEIPEGPWLLGFAPSAGRRGDGVRVPIVVKKGETAKATLPVSDVAALTAGCVEATAPRPLPCKITIEGVDGTETPDFGPGHVASAAKNQLFAGLEPRTVPIAPGKYRLTFSRGPEYDAERAEIVLGPGATVTSTKALHRVLDTAGYVSTDFHQHTILSADAPVGTQDRILANAAEGLEVAVASEHNVVADLEPLVRKLGLASLHVAIAGDEITTDASKKPWGHANVFPLVADPSKPRGGAFAVRERTALEVFADVRALPGSHIIQVNHPRSGSNGYFDQLAFDRKSGVGTAPGYDPAFDSLEVWNGRNVDARDKVLEDFFALLRTSHPVTPIAATDTHGIVGQEPGYPRTWVRVGKDDAFEAWDDARTDAVVRGVRELRDVVLSNGPIVGVSANGAPIGGIAKAKKGTVEIKVHVSSSPFVAVDRAEIRVVGAAKAVGSTQVTLTPKKTARGVLEADATFTLRATADDAFVVIVRGSSPMRPMLSGEDREIMPWAMTGAVWIDGDGDGKSLGR